MPDEPEEYADLKASGLDEQAYLYKKCYKTQKANIYNSHVSFGDFFAFFFGNYNKFFKTIIQFFCLTGRF